MNENLIYKTEWIIISKHSQLPTTQLSFRVEHNSSYSDILLLFAPSQSVFNHRPRLEPLGNLIYVGKPQYGTPLLHNSINFSFFFHFHF